MQCSSRNLIIVPVIPRPDISKVVCYICTVLPDQALVYNKSINNLSYIFDGRYT